MKIVIIVPQYRPLGQYYEIPLGLGYISSSLKSKGLEVSLINLNDPLLDKNRLQDEVKTSDILCTGGLSVHYHLVKQILIYAKSVNPKIKTVVGGGLFSSTPQLMYEMLSPNIDIGVVGEGEEALADEILLGDLGKGIVQVDHPIMDLDSLPFPDYDGLGVDTFLDRQLAGDEHYLYPLDKPRCLPIISSRSCPHNCSFCFHPTGKIYRQRSLDNFFKEVEYLIERYQVNMIAVLDELISVFPERINLFCERIKKYDLKWMTQMRVDSVDQDTINMLKDSGCFQISYGIEHVNDSLLESYNKKTTIKQIETALDMTYNAGIGIQGNILLGGIKETTSTVWEAVGWRDRNLKYMINITPVIPYPGTDLFNYGVSKGMIEPRSFIERGCGFINFSNVMLDFPVAFKFGELSESVSLYRDGYRGEIRKVKVRCPHCKKEIEYSGLYWGATAISFTQNRAYRIACRNCNQRFDFNW